jgi:glutamate-ammonia-ligase adenylyltransferase
VRGLHEEAATQEPLMARITASPYLAGRAVPMNRIGDLLAGDAPDIAETRTLLDASPEAARLVAGIATYSPFLSQIIRRHPAWLHAALTTAPEARLDALRTALATDVRAAGDEPAAMRLFRRFRSEAALLVALCECGGVWPVERSTQALADIADAAVRQAVDFMLRTQLDAGKLAGLSVDEPGPGSGLVVLALGKHGAGELNYSSDIDLVVFFDPDAPVAGGAEPARIFVRMAQGLVKLLQERTGDGYAFRVDLRLRPDPGSTQAAVSLPAAYAYYETVGQNWERAAYIKARPVAGDLALGKRFLNDLSPFIWRKYFDFAAIADIHAMKRQIHAVRGHETVALAGHDIKLGRGGIREIEFFVQTQQLVFGGRRPGLQGARTLDMLGELTRENWIAPQARDELSEAYRFLRSVEHRLQMQHDEQTQRLPVDGDALQRLARFCGYSGTPAFGKALDRQARRVERHYALLFEEGPSLANDIGSLVFTGTDDDPETLATIRRLGFRAPETTTETVRGWHFGRRPAVTSARAREALTELTPALLVSLGRTSDPDAALAALDRAFVHMKAATELLSLLISHDHLRDLFAEILGTAPRLAELVAQRPHVLDAVIDPAFGDAAVTQDIVDARLRDATGTPDETEIFLDRIRDATRHETFLAGARLLSGVYDPRQAGRGWSAVAEAAVRLCFERVCTDFATEHGKVRGGRACVLAMGRLGAGEMTAGSDLDLVVVYDTPPDAAPSEGRRPLDPSTYYTRLTQRLISAITAPTRRGVLYEVDMRLRPSGRKGPLASHLTSFRDYFATEAETWERMALIKGRPIAGEPALADEIARAVAAIVTRPADAAAIRKDVREMRALIAQEKGDADPWDMKLAAGALTDIDFLAASLVMTKGAVWPAIVANDPARTIEAAGEAGLLPAEEARTLSEARRLFGDVLQWQRLLVSERFEPSKLAPAVTRRVATALGLPDIKVLKAHLDEMRVRVRVITRKHLA